MDTRLTGSLTQTIDWLRRMVTEPEGEERRLDEEGEETERNLTAALENVRICDPAVGSGAFLLGAMHGKLRGRTHLQGKVDGSVP